MGNDIYICFIDYSEAFDKVKHSKMIEYLKEIGLDGKDMYIIIKLYWDQTAAVIQNQGCQMKQERGTTRLCAVTWSFQVIH